MEFDWDDVFMTAKDVLSDINKINYLNSVFPPDPDVETLSYDEVKKKRVSKVNGCKRQRCSHRRRYSKTYGRTEYFQRDGAS